jgi:hypothetical protein
MRRRRMLEKYKLWLAVIGSLVGLVLIGWRGNVYLNTTYARAERLAAVEQGSQCNEIGYQIDKILRSIWEIEDRYPDGARMGPVDAKRYRELLKQLQKWEKHRDNMGCVPTMEAP